MEKINTEFIFALSFAQNLSQLLLVLSKEAILFLIYLLADKAKDLVFITKNYFLIVFTILEPSSQDLLQVVSTRKLNPKFSPIGPNLGHTK